jgi:CheY-like chemotaxis protein
MSAKTRIMIVDDSNFSIAVLKNLLEEMGFVVVGSASNLNEVRKKLYN